MVEIRQGRQINVFTIIEDKFHPRVNNMVNRLILHKCMNFRNE